MATTVLVLGATGMLARPVVRRLVADGFAVRAAVRDIAGARRVLPAECEFVRVDLRNGSDLDDAMDGCDVVYINLAPPNSPRGFDPELVGVKQVAEGAKQAGVQRVMRISTMGLPEGAGAWWVAKRKQECDDLLREAGVAHTIFQPTWFMESLPLFLLGRRIMLPDAPAEPLYWIAADDYAAQVSRAMASEAASNRTFAVQGKYPVSMRHAVIRFAAAFDPTLKLLRARGGLISAAGLVSPRAAYLRDLLTFTYQYATGFAAEETFDELGEPTMTIEDYARAIRASGDVPRK